MLTITSNALAFIKDSAKQSGAEGLSLRVAAKANEDGSIEYGIGFDEATDADVRLQQEDMEILMDPPSSELLEEATMDYVELEPGHMRIIFMNPIDPHYIPPKKSKGPTPKP